MKGEWKTFRYAEPFSRNNKGKHWVDDVNNRHHNPIGLEYTWKTKCWPNRQFTFLLSVAEVNAGQAQARARDEKLDPTLLFQWNLAMQMMTNTIQSNRVVAASPPRPTTRRSALHVLMKRRKKEENGTHTQINLRYVSRCTSHVRAPFAGKRHDRTVHVTPQ